MAAEEEKQDNAGFTVRPIPPCLCTLAALSCEYRQVKGSDRERKGTGLGLAITKGFAELLGGSVREESEVGATFAA